MTTVNTWIKNATGAEYGFFKAVTHALESFNEGDTNALGKLLVVTHGKKCKRIKRQEPERLKFAAHLKRILDHSLEGVTYKFDKDKDFGVVFEKGDNGGASIERIKCLKMLGDKTVSHKMYKEAFPPIKREPKEKTLEQKQEALEKSLEQFAKTNGMTVDQVKAMVSAL